MESVGGFHKLAIKDSCEEFFELRVPIHFESKVIENAMFNSKKRFYNELFDVINECLKDKVEVVNRDATIDKEFIYKLMTREDVIQLLFMIDFQNIFINENTSVIKPNFMFQEKLAKMKLCWSYYGNTGVNYHSLYYKLIYKLYKNVKNKIELFYFSQSTTFVYPKSLPQKNIILEMF